MYLIFNLKNRYKCFCINKRILRLEIRVLALSDQRMPVVKSERSKVKYWIAASLRFTSQYSSYI